MIYCDFCSAGAWKKYKSQLHHQTVQLALFLLLEYYFLDNDVIIIRDSNDYDMEVNSVETLLDDYLMSFFR